MIDAIAPQDVLDEYSYFHAARADLLRRLERWTEAASAYRRALELTTNGPERAYLAGRLDAVTRRTASGPGGRSQSPS
jgi:RNA polymerase sigma-70 factor (ECF subfamily)